MISKIISPLVVGLFYNNLSQSPCLIGGPLSQSDPYTPPNDYQKNCALYEP